LREYEYSLANEQVNLNTAAAILECDKEDERELFAHKNFIQFFREKFDGPYPEHFEYFVNEGKGQKKEYFIGLRGEGLGVKI
jgi:transcription elongation factor GreA-like protein